MRVFIVNHTCVEYGRRSGHLVVASTPESALEMTSRSFQYAMGELSVREVDLSVEGEVTNWDETDWF